MQLDKIPIKHVLCFYLAPHTSRADKVQILSKYKLHDIIHTPEKFISNKKTISFIKTKNSQIADNIIKWLNKSSLHNILCYHQNNYPKELKEISSAPLILFCYGNIELLKTTKIAIVGSRKAGNYARENAALFAKSLSNLGITIVSGLAKGIDTVAAESTLQNNGNTIAILGSGPNICYPPSNLTLYKQISTKGLVISQFVPDTQPKAQHFPQRNALISALSEGTLVIEAKINSGSLITAKYAIEQNKEVFVIPGAINDHNFHGSNKLIQQGAKLVLNANDIIDDIKYIYLKNLNNDYTTIKVNILKLLRQEAYNIDEIIAATELRRDLILSALLQLEGTKLITFKDGRYLKNDVI